MNKLPIVTFIVLFIMGSSILAIAQDPTCYNCPGNGRPPFGDAHIGGDVPIDERLSGNRRPFGPAHESRMLKKGALAPSRDDQMAFAAFLRTRNTGLIRLLPRENHTNLTKTSQNIVGGGAYYSFGNLTHVYGFGSDIELQAGSLSVGFAGNDYGLLTNLGDVPLEGLTLADQRLTFVAAYRPPLTSPEARAEFQRFRTGVTIGGIKYQSKLPVAVNSTYLLRSINYRRTDVLVAFRVVRTDTDGSVTIAWKLLKRYSPPELKRSR